MENMLCCFYRYALQVCAGLSRGVLTFYSQNTNWLHLVLDFFFLQESEGNTFVGEQNYKQDIGGIEASVSAVFQACHSATPSFLVD